MAELWVVATGNRHKLAEIRDILADSEIGIVGPRDLGIELEVEEWAESFAGNAALKAIAWARRASTPALADDSGLEVDALGGAPGVHSARYAGEPSDDNANNAKLVRELAALGAHVSRSCRYRAVLALARPAEDPGTSLLSRRAIDALLPDDHALVEEGGQWWEVATFSGVMEGEIAHEARGAGGFGYDPWVSLADGRHVAELPAEEKNARSHRAMALRKLREWTATEGQGKS